MKFILAFPPLVATLMTIRADAQPQDPALNLGDPAPSLQVRSWLKGTPLREFEPGKVYVVEFWATWCAPCKAAMPHLSRLAAEYKDSVVFIGVDVYEREFTPLGRIQHLVDSMGDRIAFRVALEEGKRMETGWIDAADVKDQGIPKTFVVDAQGKLAWIGEPFQLEDVLPKVVANAWNLKEALAKRNSDRWLRSLDDSLNYEFARFMTMDGKQKPGYYDSVLRLANEFVRSEPRLEYAPRVAFHIFSALLHTNPHRALEYANRLVATTTYEPGPPYEVVTNAIGAFSGTISLPAEIYRLGVRTYQEYLDHFPYPELINRSRIYRIMADWNRRAGDKAIATASAKGYAAYRPAAPVHPADK